MRGFDIALVSTSVLTAFVPLLVIGGRGDGGVVVLGTLAAAIGAAIAAMACRWWPGLDASGWLLWLAAWLFNPVVIAGIIYILSQYECLLGQSRGWQCMGLALAILAAPITLVAPTVAVIVHVIARRSGSVPG
jgi:hypothetical protein